MKPAQMSDGMLIAAFAATGDEEAFRELIRRHGPMVYRTCRRVTGNTPDGEDAAQQVFATLAQLAERLTTKTTLGGWLYGTAWRVSMRTRRAREARRRH